jgi:hypothetical protein
MKATWLRVEYASSRLRSVWPKARNAAHTMVAAVLTASIQRAASLSAKG